MNKPKIFDDITEKIDLESILASAGN